VRVLAVAFAVLLLAGCGSQPAAPAASKTDPSPNTTDPASAEVSFAKDIQLLVTASCLPCHSGAGSSSSNWTTYADVMGAVVAGKPDSSRFYQKLRDGRMPPGGKLGSTELALVYRWISEGAKNN
jgi:hypothetical protein